MHQTGNLLQSLFLPQRRLPLILNLELSPVTLPLAACALCWSHSGCALSAAVPTSSGIRPVVVLTCASSTAW